MSDIYYEPGNYGLTVVGGVDEEGLSYEFNTLQVWKHDDGRVFYGCDAGCSCPTPFENFNSIDQLTEITDETFNDFARTVADFDNPGSAYEAKPRTWGTLTVDGLYVGAMTPDKTELLAQVSKLLDSSSKRRRRASTRS